MNSAEHFGNGAVSQKTDSNGTLSGGALSSGAQLMVEYPAEGWHKWIFKAPVYLWRLGLGFLIGRYVIVITTTGRKSKLPRPTMVEWHRSGGKKFVVANWGERTQWYKNIQADPHVTIQTSDGTESMIARRISDDAELLTAYHVIQRENPVMTQWYLDAHGVENATDAALLAKKDDLYLITFDPIDEPTPPPLQADLVWVWGVVGWLLLMLRRSGRRR